MSEELAARVPANVDQAEYWNSAAGQKWATFQAALDQRFQPLTDGLLARAAAGAGERVVDVGCGTGATTLRLAEAVGAEGSVLAIDISLPLLALARQRSEAGGHGHVRFQCADAQTHRFDDVADLLFSRFGVMFFEDPIAAFRNLATGLRPGGRLGFVCWAALERNPLFAVPLASGVRHLGPPDPQPPRAPGPLAFSDRDYVEEILAAAGFVSIEVEQVETTLPCAPTAAAEAEFACMLGPLARLIIAHEADQATREAIVQDVAVGFQPYQGAGGVHLPATVFHVSAIRP